MKTTLIALAAAGLVAAQNLGGQPDCALPCLRDALPHAGCGPADVACICRPETQQRIMGMVAPCILSKCDADEVARVAGVAAAACGQAGGAHPGAPGVSAGAHHGGPGASGGAHPGAPDVSGGPGGPGGPGAPGSSYVSGSWVGGVPVTGTHSDGSYSSSTQTFPGLVPTPGASRTYPGDDDDYTSSLWGSGTATLSSHTGLTTGLSSTSSDGSIIATATQSDGFTSTTTTLGSPDVAGAAPGGPAAGALAAVLAFALIL